MDKAAMEAFVCIADTGSVTRAAERLHLTQPAISKRLAQLEDDLGQPLFDRIGRKLLLTHAGAALLPSARHILHVFEGARSEVQAASDRIEGVIRLATSHYIGLYRLPDYLKTYIRRFPEVRFDMTFTESETACQLVTDGRVDLALATMPPKPDSGLELTPVWHDRLMLATGQTHPLATKASISIADLRGWPAIFPDESTFTWRLLRSAFPDDYDTFDIQTSTNYLETIAMMVESGLGWSLLPDIMIASKPGLKGQVLEGNTPIRPLGIVTHRQRTPSPAVKVFVSLLKSGEQSIPAP